MAEPAPPPVLWEPSQELVEGATLTRYIWWLAYERGLEFEDYHALQRWSVERLDDFWGSIWEFFDVSATEPYAQVLGARAMPGTEWFPGARLSYAEHIFRGKHNGATAIHHASELRELDTMTWGQLRSLTAEIAGGLRALGVQSGDRVVAYMPNVPEAIAAFLACAWIGATWSSCSPDFGARSVVDRFGQIEPKVLFAVDGYRYNGRDFDRMEVVAGLEAAMPTLEHTVVLPYLSPSPDLGRLEKALTWDELRGHGHGKETPAFEQLPFDHPLWVLYSSGTTGLPKAIVHGQGGILLEHLKKMHLHVNAQEGDRVFWFTTTGWMMWNFLVGVLLTPAQIVLYDGSPGHPDLGVLWDLAERTGMTCFGTSAAYIGSCMKAGVAPGEGRDLSELRSVGSTGSPLAPEGFAWVYEHVGKDTWLFSTSGGTDVCTAFVGGCPLLPVHLGELQCRALGAAVEAFDEEGNALFEEVGELVITEPMPSMPVSFWNDPGGERLRESYFSMYSGIWRHGDWIEITARGTAVIHGRSDSTINRGGVRMGTSEIYRAVLKIDEIVDALVVDVPAAGAGEDTWMPLFVVLRAGTLLDDALKSEIARRVRTECSPRHVPSEVLAVDELPRTLSGKLLEVPVKRILMGAPADDAASRDSLQNPGALDTFVALAEARASAGFPAAS
jgi:acetoacetyl-CoA synthetase